mgnify:CR=1 FL=1
MPDYKKSKIYRIVNDENDNFYIGSTTQPLHKRMCEHRKLHNCMSKNLGVDLKYCKIILIEAFECENRQEILKKEREYFDKYKLECKDTFVNKMKPYVSEEEKKEHYKQYRFDNKEKKKEYSKQYQINNKDKLIELSKQYRINNKEKVKQYFIDNKEKRKQYVIDNDEHIKKIRKKYNIDNKAKKQQYYIDNKEPLKNQHKEYYINNKEHIKLLNKQYRIDNKELIRENAKQQYLKIKETKLKKASIKYTCECGSISRVGNKSQHNKTIKHLDYLKTII